MFGLWRIETFICSLISSALISVGLGERGTQSWQGARRARWRSPSLAPRPAHSKAELCKPFRRAHLPNRQVSARPFHYLFVWIFWVRLTSRVLGWRNKWDENIGNWAKEFSWNYTRIRQRQNRNWRFLPAPRTPTSLSPPQFHRLLTHPRGLVIRSQKVAFIVLNSWRKEAHPCLAASCCPSLVNVLSPSPWGVMTRPQSFIKDDAACRWNVPFKKPQTGTFVP